MKVFLNNFLSFLFFQKRIIFGVSSFAVFSGVLFAQDEMQPQVYNFSSFAQVQRSVTKELLSKTPEKFRSHRIRHTPLQCTP